MTDESPTALTAKDRFIARVAALLTRATYRDVEVHWAEPPPLTEPQLSVANHFGGFSDALILVDALPRRPGIVARDVIWRIPVAGWFMNWIGGIPVHKPEDGGGRSTNDQMFASCYDALRDGGHLLIFPEGVTRNEPSIAPVKTGAARIALGARASGAEGILIVPMGIHYEEKAALRSRVVVNGGRAIDLDREVAQATAGTEPVTADNREAVRQLTDEIEQQLRRVAPDYADWAEARALTFAADVTLRDHLADPADAVPIGLRDRLANALAQRPAEHRQAIQAAATAYQSDLDGLGIDDAGLHQRLSTGRLMLWLLFQVLIGVVLAPFAVVGALINLVPYLIVKAVGVLRVAPSVHATIKPIVAFVAFGITWGIVVWTAVSRFGITGGAAAVVLLPVYLAAVLLLADRVVLVVRTLCRWRAEGQVAGLSDRVAAHRGAVVAAVHEVGA